jgi:hypothetical protein
MKLTCAIVAGAALQVAAPAYALPAEGPRETVDVEFTTAQPGAAAGATYRFAIRAPDGQPPALRRIVLAPPAGARIDTSVPAPCAASDEDLRLRGDGACPAASLLGVGSAELVVVGLGRQTFTQSAFNADGQQFQTVKSGDQVQAVVRGLLTEEGLDLRIPTCVTGGQPPGGCVSDQAFLLASELVLRPYVAAGRSYFTTPPSCPPSGRWRSEVALTYGDGVTERVFPEQPCEAGRAPACRSRRRVVFRALARVGLRTISVVLRGRRLVLDPVRPVLDLRGLPRGRYTVRVRAVTRSGRRLGFVRRYRTCTA